MMTTTRNMHALVDTFLHKPLTLHETQQEAEIYLPGAHAPENIRRALKVMPVIVTIELAPHSSAMPMHHQPALQLITRG